LLELISYFQKDESPGEQYWIVTGTAANHESTEQRIKHMEFDKEFFIPIGIDKHVQLMHEMTVSPC